MIVFHCEVPTSSRPFGPFNMLKLREILFEDVTV